MGKCRICLNRARLEHDVRLISAALHGTWTKELLGSFAKWLIDRDGPDPGLPAVFTSHGPFFTSLDEHFSDTAQVTESRLLDLFTVAGLRQHLLPTQYLCSVLGLDVSTDLKNEHAESGRVDAILASAQAERLRAELVRFNAWLEREGRPVRTRRLYLSSAAKLLKYAKVEAISDLDQDMLAGYLDEVPGARCNLGALLRFARVVLQHDVAMPQRGKATSLTPKPVATLRALLKQIEAGHPNVALEVYERAVSVCLKISLAAIQAGRWCPERAGKAFLVVSPDERVACPAALNHVIEGWLSWITLKG